MAEQPKKQRRTPTAATLYRNITDYMKREELSEAEPIGMLLDQLRETIVEEATKR